MENKKICKLIILGLIIYCLIFVIIFLPGYLRKLHDKMYIIYGNDLHIKLENGEWSDIENINDYKFNKFNVYSGNSFLGKFKILNSNTLILYDDYYNKVNYSDTIFAYNSNFDVSVVDLIETEKNEKDDLVIDSVLDKVKISNYNDLNLFQKVSWDFDNDGVIENLYCISNFYTYEDFPKLFSIVFIEKNNKIDIIKSNIIDNIDLNVEESYTIAKVIDLRSDGKYELLLSNDYFSRPYDSCAIIYSLSGKYKEITNLCN